MAVVLAIDRANRQMSLGFPTPAVCRWTPPKPRRRHKAIRTGVVQLDLDLVVADLLAEDERAAEAERFLDARCGPERSHLSWAEADIKRLHLWLLERSLELLADHRASFGTVCEILDWMKEAPHERPQGFSYRVCCRLSGYDPDELLALTQYELQRVRDDYSPD